MPSAAELLPALLVVAGVLGLAIGSFLNVVIHRLPLHLSLSRPGSRCPTCGTPIRARDNVPVLGWLLLRGRCHTCRAPIGVRYPLVEAGTGVAFVAVVAALVGGARTDDLVALVPVPAWLWLTATLVSAALIDVDGHRVPPRFAALTPAVTVVLLVAAAAPAGEWTAVGRALVGGVALAAAVVVVVVVVLRSHPEVAGLAAGAGLALGAVSWLALIVGGVLAVAAVLAGRAVPAGRVDPAGGVVKRPVPSVALLAIATAAGLVVAAAVGY